MLVDTMIGHKQQALERQENRFISLASGHWRHSAYNGCADQSDQVRYNPDGGGAQDVATTNTSSFISLMLV